MRLFTEGARSAIRETLTVYWSGAAPGEFGVPELASGELAKEDAADTLEAEACRRAVEGVEKPVGWYKGKPGGSTCGSTPTYCSCFS